MVALSREELLVENFDKAGPFFLAGDIGGTNSNFGIFSLKDRPLLIAAMHYKSKDITDFTLFMQQVLADIKARYAIEFKSACIGAAGVVYPHRVTVQPTNLPFEINTHDIAHATGLKDLFLINDFEAVALGVELISPEDIIVISKGTTRLHSNMGFLGAGTGLGKSIKVWCAGNGGSYVPVSSEGGHADAAFYEGEELGFSAFVYANYGLCPISWEAVLSGYGIQKIYRFLGTQRDYPLTKVSKEIEEHDLNPDLISTYAREDLRCKDTFEFYVKMYARCAKNFALDALTLNGLYIAGGIAAKNIALFKDPLFMGEFVRCGKQSARLATMPIYLISNYNVSLYGAVVAAQLRHEGRL